jgi:hypothetical protein
MKRLLVTASPWLKLLGLGCTNALFLFPSATWTIVAFDQPETTLRGPHSSWELMTPLPEGAVFAATVAGNDGRIYVISGFKGPDTEVLTSANRVYNPDENCWALRAPVPPHARSQAGLWR